MQLAIRGRKRETKEWWGFAGLRSRSVVAAEGKVFTTEARADPCHADEAPLGAFIIPTLTSSTPRPLHAPSDLPSPSKWDIL